MGWLGQYMILLPSRNVSIVSLGASWGSSQQCPLGDTRPLQPFISDGYDDAFSASVLYRALDVATDTTRSAHSHNQPRAQPSRIDGPVGHTAIDTAVSDADYDTTREAARSPARQALGDDDVEVEDAAEANADSASPSLPSNSSSPPSPFGSCSCACPPGRGFGGCYHLRHPPKGHTDLERCGDFLDRAPRDCPMVGIARQCASPPKPADEDCAAAGRAMRGDVGSKTVWGGHLNCSLRTPCTGEHGPPADTSLAPAAVTSAAAVGSFVPTATCSCMPVRYGDYACAWSAASCAARKKAKEEKWR